MNTHSIAGETDTSDNTVLFFSLNKTLISGFEEEQNQKMFPAHFEIVHEQNTISLCAKSDKFGISRNVALDNDE